MKETVSQALVIFEALLLLCPISVLTISYIPVLAAAYIHEGEKIPGAMHLAVVFIAIATLGQFSGWAVVYRFIREGRTGLRELKQWMVVAATAAAALAMLGIIVMTLKYLDIEVPVISEVLWIGVFGAPALLPFAHLAIERQFALSNAELREGGI